jgi:YYY domain-containing protein
MMADDQRPEPADDQARPSVDVGKRAAAVGLLAVIALSLALRLYGLSWDQGFDWTPHPDERAILMRVAELSPPSVGDLGVLLDAEESPWNPRWFPYGSFPLYFLKGVQLIYGLLPVSDLNDLRIAGRLVSALADVATVAMVFVIGKTLYTRRIGLWASALVTLAVIHIQLSHFFAVDTFLALLTVLTMYFLVRVAREGRVGDSVFAGLFLGLGLATKVSLAPILGAFAVAHLMYAFGLADRTSSHRATGLTDRTSKAIQGVFVGGFTAGAAFLIAQPYALIDMDRFLDDVSEQSEMVRRIRDYPYTRQYIDTTPYLYQARQLATWGLGWPLGILAWAALAHTALRGLRPTIGLAYVVVGWALPMALLIRFDSVIAVMAASALAIVALVVTLPLRRSDTRLDVLLLAWVAPYFFITGAFEVKFLRYMIPITPFLLLFASRLAADLWDRVRLADRTAVQRAMRTVVGLALASVFATTGFYAVSYLGLYGKTHPAVAASTWINANAPQGSVVLKEHWEEGLPGMQDYQVRELQLYEPDTSGKLQNVSAELARGDYLVLFSNRLYGTIPRLEERYPVTREYYRQLFSGELGYEFVQQFTAYPELLGVEFVDATYERPGLPEPTRLTEASATFGLGLGFADESFSVYDHPKVLVFENQTHMTREVIYDQLNQAAGGFPDGAFSAPRPVETPGKSLLYSQEDARSQQEGGTWTDIVRADSWTNRMPVLAWLLVVEGLAVLAFPLVFAICGPLPDRGWLLSKALGPFFVGLVVWLLASLHWMAFSRASVSVGALAVFALSVAVLLRRRDAIKSYVATHWRTIAIGEAVFLAAFFAFLLIRMANPDLWHPFRGGEKPMDLAYLNAVVRSTFMPPYDPWFAGGYLNYYYWGQFLVATIIHATGIASGVAFNLAIPWFFALTAGASYSLVYNLVESTRRRSATAGGLGSLSTGFWSSSVAAGIVGALFVVVLGNLDGAVQLGESAWRVVVQGLPAGEFDFWRSSRMMPPDPPGHEITEFPFFTFLFADLHAHLMALPFTIVALGLAAAVAIGAYRSVNGERRWGLSAVGRLAVMGVVIGSLRVINAWDYPAYLAIAAGAVAIGELLSHGGVGLTVALRIGVKSAFVVGIGYVAFLPYHRSYETFFSSIESTTNTTVLWQFLAISGLFVFILGSYYVWTLRGFLLAAGASAGRWLSRLTDTVAAENETAAIGRAAQVRAGQVLALVGLALGFGYLVTAAASGVAGDTIVFASVAVVAVGYAGARALTRFDAASPELAFVSLAAGAAFMIVVGLDFVRVEGDIDRMNSVFKFYLQVWVLLAVASGYLLWRLLSRPTNSRLARMWRRVWIAALALLIVSTAVYPVFGARDRLRDRFDDNVTPMTLDGTAYIDGATYRDPEGNIDLAADFEGIEWLRQNVEGSPVILEANTPTYRWGGRVSIYTGLPSVVGWQWHQEQQRWDNRADVGRRIRDVKNIYGSANPSDALSLLRKYDVKYVYVGQLERAYHPDGVEKFDGPMAPFLELVFESDAVAIYEVRPSEL